MTMDGTIDVQAPCVPEAAPIATIALCKGGGAGQSIRLRRAASLFGTKSGCKFVLRHPAVNGRHCVIVNTGYRLILRDLVTGGQTLRNGLKVEQETLVDADHIQIGPWDLRVDLHEPGVRGVGDSPVIVDLEPDPTVLAVEDATDGRIRKLPRDVSVLGRAPGCDIVVRDREASGVHAIIFSYLGRPAIFDLASENGTWINQQRAVFAMLHDQDVILLGASTFRFRCNVPSNRNGSAGKNGQILKPQAFVNPEGTVSDLVDFSTETQRV